VELEKSIANPLYEVNICIIKAAEAIKVLMLRSKKNRETLLRIVRDKTNILTRVVRVKSEGNYTPSSLSLLALVPLAL
jgi:hypothetical protein